MSSNIHIFTHSDLDGAGCLLALIWAFPDAIITYTVIGSSHSFEEEFKRATSRKSIDQYSTVFVTDLSIHEKDIYLIDKKNVVYIDHHKTSLNLKFNHAKTFVKIFSSCTLFLYKLFKTKLDINSAQKELLILIDDYDSYKLQFIKTKDLNMLFWSHYNHNVSLFLQDFNQGINKYTPLQINALNIQKQKIQNTIDGLVVYRTTANIQGILCNIVATFADIAINDVSDFIINKFIPDIAIVINLKNSRVSFRRNNREIDVSLLAKKLCDGGGHEAAAGGKVTEQFLEFTKVFKPV